MIKNALRASRFCVLENIPYSFGKPFGLKNYNIPQSVLVGEVDKMPQVVQQANKGRSLIFINGVPSTDRLEFSI